MSKVLGLLGSPRRDQNTDSLLAASLAGAKAAGADCLQLHIADLAIAPCFSCYACARTGHCLVDDEMQAVYDQMAQADVILLASPLYFSGVSAQMKALIDRCQVGWSRQNALQLPALTPEQRRLGAFLCTGGAPNRGGNNFLPAIATAKLCFQALQVEYRGDLVAADTDRSQVADRPELLAEARALGARLVQEVAQ